MNSLTRALSLSVPYSSSSPHTPCRTHTYQLEVISTNPTPAAMADDADMRNELSDMQQRADQLADEVRMTTTS